MVSLRASHVGISVECLLMQQLASSERGEWEEGRARGGEERRWEGGQKAARWKSVFCNLL